MELDRHLQGHMPSDKCYLTHTQSHIPGLSVTSFHGLKCKCQHAVPTVNTALCHPFNIKHLQTLMSDKHKPVSNNHNIILHLKLLHRGHYINVSMEINLGLFRYQYQKMPHIQLEMLDWVLAGTQVCASICHHMIY